MWHGQRREGSREAVQDTGKEMAQCKGRDAGWFWGDEMVQVREQM